MRATDRGSADGWWRWQGNSTSDEEEGETKIDDQYPCPSHPDYRDKDDR